MSASTWPVRLELTRFDAFNIDHRHHAANDRGKLHLAFLSSSTSSVSGMSDAPKSTVLESICLMPPPEPMDW